MSHFDDMHLTLRVPTGVLFEGPVTVLTAVDGQGGFGLLPNHVDFVTALVPSVLAVTTAQGEERIFGIDEGLLVKKAAVVDVAIRRGVEGTDLETLHAQVHDNFIELEDEERAARSALSRLEATLVRGFVNLRQPRL